jgi:hypothetical protein
MNNINYLGFLMVIVPLLIYMITLDMFSCWENIKLTISSFFIALMIMGYICLIYFFLSYPK